MEPTTVMMIVLGVMIVAMFLTGIFIGYAYGKGRNTAYQKLQKEKEDLEQEHKLYEEYHTNQEIKQRKVINNFYQNNAIRDLKTAIELIEKSKVEEEASKHYLKYDELPFEPRSTKYLNVLLGENKYILRVHNPSASSMGECVFLMDSEVMPEKILNLSDLEKVVAIFSDKSKTIFDDMKFELIDKEENHE